MAFTSIAGWVRCAPRSPSEALQKCWNILHVNGLSFLILPYTAYWRFVSLVCILWRSTLGLLDGLISSKWEQAATFTGEFCPSTPRAWASATRVLRPRAVQRARRGRVAVVGAGVLPQLFKRQLLLSSRDSLPFLDACTSSVSKQNCRTPFALDMSEGETVLCVISRIFQS